MIKVLFVVLFDATILALALAFIVWLIRAGRRL